MRRSHMLLCSALLLAACGGGNRPDPYTPSPGAGDPAPAPEPYVCPEGMPRYKCEQLERQNQADPTR